MFQRIRSLLLSSLLCGLMLFSTLFASPLVVAQTLEWQDVPAEFDYSSRPAFDRVKREYSSLITITNTSDADFAGPMRLVIDASNHNLIAPDGEIDSAPYRILEDVVLAQGDSVQVQLNFALKRAAFSLSLRLQLEQQTNTSILDLDENQIALFYKREDGNYDGWGLHLFNGEGCGNYASPTTESVHFNNWPNPYPEDGIHPEYGAYYILSIEKGAPCYNFIIHKGDDKALGEQNSRFETSNGNEGFTFDGYPEIWYSPLTERPLTIEGARAHWVDNDSLLWLTDTSASRYSLYYSPNADLSIVDGNKLSGASAVALRPDNIEESHKQDMPHLSSFSEFSLELDNQDPKQLAKMQLLAVSEDNDGNIVDITRVQIPRLLDDLYTSGNDDADEATLGVAYEGDTISATVWAPTATQVNIQIFDKNKTFIRSRAMQLNNATGVWQYSADASALDRMFYRYEIKVFHPLTQQNETLLSTDPYSISLSSNGRYSQFVDLSDMTAADLVPSGWENHTAPSLSSPEDMVIYETHIRDFSILDESTRPEYRGKYMAFTQSDSVPVKHLSRLQASGLTHVHLLPANDIATIEEDTTKRIDLTSSVDELCARVANVPVCGAEDGSATLMQVLESYDPSSTDAQALVESMRGLDGFNWGYDPHHFAAPEGSYATDPDGEARIKEMRAMIMALHEMGLGVVLDVVYNHTASSGLFDNSVLDKVVPGYYHRFSEVSGEIERSTCCENTATEHKMMAKLMNDSLVMFAQHFAFDSFRFDLMGHVPKQAVLDARAAVQAIDSDSYFYGEGWNFGEVVNDRRFEQATQFNMAGTEIGTFNDRLREAVRSAELFKENGSLNDQDIIRLSMAGNLVDYQWVSASGTYLAGKDYDWNGSPAAYAIDPADSINYISKHDNETLWDQLQYGLPTEMTLPDRTRVQGVAMSIPLLSQGIPFLHMGGELLRSKSMDRNTYDAGDWFNRVDFSANQSTWNVGLPLAQDNSARWDEITAISANPNSDIDAQSMLLARAIFTDFLSIRASSPLFKLTTAEDVIERVKFHNVGQGQVQGLIVMSIDDGIGLSDIDPEHDAIVVMVNGSDESQSFEISQSNNFTLHPVQSMSEDGRLAEAHFAGSAFTVPALTTAVFVKVQNGAQGFGLSALPPYGDQAIYIRGSMNGWDTSNPMEYEGNDKYSAEIFLSAGDYAFKIADENFDKANIGGGFSVAIGENVTLSNYGDNLLLNIAQDATYQFSLDASNSSNPVLVVSSDDIMPPPDTGPYANTFYVRGSMNDWGLADNAAFSYEGDNVYQVSVPLSAQRHVFKVADAGWSAPNIGGSSANQTVILDTPWNVSNSSGSQNLAVDISVEGRYLFSIDADNPAEPVLTISQDIPPFAQALYLRGSMNAWGSTQAFGYDGIGIYSTSLFLDAGAPVFKVADDGWSVQFGSGNTNSVEESIPMYLNGGDSVLNLNEAGTYEFIFDTKPDPASLMVKPVNP